MNQRRVGFVPKESKPQDMDIGGKRSGDTAGGRPGGNNLTDMFQLEDTACETYCSITGLSAYFADLLSLLRRTRRSKNVTADTTTLFDVLDKRRPDLKSLELTCANSQTLVPYISLVNEVLESYIHRHEYEEPKMANPLLSDFPGSTLSIGLVASGFAPATAKVCESDQAVHQPGDTIEPVYNCIISKQMYSFTHFPYPKPCDEVTQILRAFNVRMPELIAAFRMPKHILDTMAIVTQKQPEVVKTQLRRGTDEVFARQNAAEALGIQQAEFSAITGETFFPSWFADLLAGLSEENKPSPFRSGCSWTAAKLWGYPSMEDMVKRTSSTGLTLIKAELMKRSNLEFQDILDLAKSQCFGQDLVIVNNDGSKEFHNSLEGLRLLASSSEPPFKDLTEEICFSLQAFLRLRAKLGWTTRDLDAAVFSLRSNEMQKFPHAPTPGGQILLHLPIRAQGHRFGGAAQLAH